MKKIIIFAAALLLGCSAMSAQNKGDMSVGWYIRLFCRRQQDQHHIKFYYS